MMHIQSFVVNMIEENCYLLWDDNGSAAIIDCGAYYPEEQKQIGDFITANHLHLEHLLNTHAHFDHLFGASYIYEHFGTKMEINETERETYESSPGQTRQFMRRDLPLSLPPVGNYFKDGDDIHVGDITLRVISTPGHTPGGVCFYCEESKVLFSGDSLFRGQIGRCDFPGGDEPQLIKALKTKILCLSDDVQILPGHGPSSTIGYERSYNPFMK